MLAFVLTPFVVFSFFVLAFWGFVSWTDPAEEGGCALRRKGADTPHYCSFCRKTVKGFDHHCSWLNTCISTRNYMHFYFLGVSGSLLYFYMVAVGILVQFLTPEDKLVQRFGSESVARASWGVFDAVSGWVAVSFVVLAAFHTYLLCIGLGTFDWVVLQGQKRQEQLARRRMQRRAGQQEQQERQEEASFCGAASSCCELLRVRNSSVHGADVETGAGGRSGNGVGGREAPSGSGQGTSSRGTEPGVAAAAEPSWSNTTSDERPRGDRQAVGHLEDGGVTGDRGKGTNGSR